MIYESPLVQLLQGLETALATGFTDRAGQPRLTQAIATPVELPAVAGYPYALLAPEPADTEDGSATSRVRVVLYLDAVLGPAAMFDALELAWQAQLYLAAKLERCELAPGVAGGRVASSDFGDIFAPDAEAGATPYAFFITLLLTVQWLED